MDTPQGKVHICMGSSWKVRHPKEYMQGYQLRTFLTEVEVGISPF